MRLRSSLIPARGWTLPRALSLRLMESIPCGVFLPWPCPFCRRPSPSSVRAPNQGSCLEEGWRRRWGRSSLRVLQGRLAAAAKPSQDPAPPGREAWDREGWLPRRGWPCRRTVVCGCEDAAARPEEVRPQQGKSRRRAEPWCCCPESPDGAHRRAVQPVSGGGTVLLLLFTK